MRSALVIAVLVLVACTERPPPNEAQISAMASALIEKEGLVWGPVTSVWPPGEADADGRRWWQVDYREYRQIRHPVVLVDAESGWARFAEPGERVRVGISPQRSRTVDRPSSPSGPDGTTWILILRDFPLDEREAAGKEAERLNAMAASTALRPLFSVRSTTTAGLQLVYGWDGERGIRRDEAVVDYLSRWGEPLPERWVDLSAAP